jgi:hypothetical protein
VAGEGDPDRWPRHPLGSRHHEGGHAPPLRGGRPVDRDGIAPPGDQAITSRRLSTAPGLRTPIEPCPTLIPAVLDQREDGSRSEASN